MAKFSWAVTILGTIIGALTLLGTMFSARSAPQEAAGYAMAVAFAVVPYIFTRAVQALSTNESATDIKAIRKALEARNSEAE